MNGSGQAFTASDVRDLLLDPYRFAEIAVEFAKRGAIGAMETEPGYKELMTQFCVREIHSHVSAVTETSQSPIETIFLNSLGLCFLQTCFPVIVRLFRRDAIREIEQFDEVMAAHDEFLQWFKSEYGETNLVQDLIAYFDLAVEASHLPREEADSVIEAIISYRLLDSAALIHCSPQAPLPGIKVDGRSIRADALFWIPEKPSKKVALECDGYEFHGSRDSFVRDRKRDRVLADCGISVVRFSGREIMDDPAGVAYEMHKRLYTELNPSYFQASMEQ